MAKISGKPQPDLPWYLDPLGLIFNSMAMGMIETVFVLPLMIFFSGLDPVNFVFPEPTGILEQCLHLSMRLLLVSLAITQALAIASCAAHGPILAGLLHFKACLDHLKKSSFQNNSLSELEQYRIICVTFHLAKEFGDAFAKYIAGAGFFIAVTANYVAVMMHGRIPFPLYLTIVAFALGIVALVTVEIPLPGLIHVSSKELLCSWKRGCPMRRSFRRKTVNSFRPLEAWVGSFFFLGRDAFLGWVQEVLNKTVDFILLV